jgi:hypothetical protein
VTQHAQVEHLFHQPPGGFTPLSRTLRAVFGNTQQALAEGKKLLIIIATDGQPTDDSGNVQINEFFSLLANKPRGVFVQIMACTDDEGAVQYLNAADENIPLLDVSDDFHSERREILRAQGAGFHFTVGDYVVKALLGPVDAYFDGLDGGARLSPRRVDGGLGVRRGTRDGRLCWIGGGHRTPRADGARA